MTTSKLEQLQAELGSNPTDAQHAISVLGDVDRYTPELVAALGRPLAETIQATTNTYTIGVGWRELTRMAEQQPAALAPALGTILELVGTAVQEYRPDRIEQLSQGDRYTSVLRALADDPSLGADVPIGIFDPLIGTPAIEHPLQGDIYRLIGSVNSPAAADRLLELQAEASYDTTGIEAGLERLCERSIRRIERAASGEEQSQSNISVAAAIGVLARVYATPIGADANVATRLASNWQPLIDSIGETGDPADISTLLAAAMVNRADGGRPIVERLVTRLTTAPTLLDGQVLGTLLSDRPDMAELLSPCLPNHTSESLPSLDAGLVAGLSNPNLVPVAEAVLRHRIQEASDDRLIHALFAATNDIGWESVETIVDAIAPAELPPPSNVHELTGPFVDAFKRADGDIDSLLLSVGDHLCRWDPAIAARLTTEGLAALETSSHGATSEWWTVLRTAATTQPSAYIEVVVDSGCLSTDGTEIRARRITQQLTAAVDAVQTVPTAVLDAAVRNLQSTDRQLVLATLDLVAAIGVYPPPDELQALTASEVTEFRERATSVVSELSEQRDELPYREIVDDEGAPAVFEDEEGPLHLKRRTATGAWTDIDVSWFRREVIEDALDRADTAATTPIVQADFDPRFPVLLALGAVLRQAPSDPQVGLFTPGSQTHWGNKGEVRAELERYGLSRFSGDVVTAIPIPEVIPDGYVSNGSRSWRTDGDGPGGITIVKRAEELLELDELDVCVSNLISVTKEDYAHVLGELTDVHPTAALLNGYSYLGRNDGDGRPRYGPPRGLDNSEALPTTRSLESALDGPFDELADLPEGDVAGAEVTCLRALAEPTPIEVEQVEAAAIETHLDAVFDISSQLRGDVGGRASSLILSRQLFLERLPVDGTVYDEWVRNRLASGDRYVPDLIQVRLETLEEEARSTEALGAVQPLGESKHHLEKVAEQLETENPMAIRLQRHLRAAVELETPTAVLAPSPRHADILRSALLDEGLVTSEDLSNPSDTIQVVHPDTARDLEPSDQLIICGPLHPEHAAFYQHPQVNRTLVLTYNPIWSGMIERHACEYVDELNTVTGADGFEPFAYPDLVGDTEPEDADSIVDSDERSETDGTDSGELEPDSGTATSGVDRTSARRRDQLDGLLDDMQRSSTREYRDESDDRQQERRTYDIETAAGETLQVSSHDRLLRYREDADTPFLWLQPRAIEPGDIIGIIPEEVETELWRERLETLYENRVDAGAATQALQLWFDSLHRIWSTIEERLTSNGQEPTDARIVEAICAELRRSPASFDRTDATVRNWFQSVLSASQPLDLAEQPELTIGPRHQQDIRAIGVAFDIERLADKADRIEEVMEAIRTINRQEGHQYRDALLDRLNGSNDWGSPDAELVEAVQLYTVEISRDTTEDYD